MAEKSKVQARNIHVQVFSRPTTVRNGSGAYVSSVQVVKSADKTQDAKIVANKPAAKKAAAKKAAAKNVAAKKPAANKKTGRKVVAATVAKKTKT